MAEGRDRNGRIKRGYRLTHGGRVVRATGKRKTAKRKTAKRKVYDYGGRRGLRKVRRKRRR